jgi:serine/threonine protein kinase
MAPEQWSGNELSARTDIYALGATLYTALTGHRPFPQVSLTELAYAVANTPPPAPSRDRPTVPAAFDAVIAQAMAKDPADRYADAATLAQAVRSAAHGRPAPYRRSRVPIAVLAAALVAIASALLLWSPWSASGHGTDRTTGGTTGKATSNTTGNQAGERTLRRTVCPKGPSITLRDHPQGATTHTLTRGTKVTEFPDRAGGGPYWRWVRADNGATGWGLTQYLRSSCTPQ